MPRKGMRSLLFSPRSPISSSSSSSSPRSNFSSTTFSPSRPSFAESVMDRTLQLAEPMILKWDPEATNFARVTSLFYENRREARDFMKQVKNIHRAMQLLVTENSFSQKLIRAQSLMQIAMKRLQKEFYQILSMNRAHLDPESISTRSSSTSIPSIYSDYEDNYEEDEDDSDEICLAGESIAEVEDVSILAMADLKTIAECMISVGYAKECVNIYKIIRKSIIDEGIYKLGVEQLSPSFVRKMDWEAMDVRIKRWLDAVKIAVNTLFKGERILSDHVFASSESIRESVFAEISKDGALILYGFPENIAKNSKKSPEKVFRFLDICTAISNHWPEMESTFSYESSTPVRSQAITSLARIGEYIRTAITDLESTIQKENSKSTVAGGGIHSLTIEWMNHLSLLADYSKVIADILPNSPGLSDSEDGSPAISRKFDYLILLLLAKIDSKAKKYKDVSLSYLFLANNHQYVVVKARASNLKYLLGDDWVASQEAKVKQFTSSYQRVGWGHVMESLPKDPSGSYSPEEAKETFKGFKAAFDQAYRKQSAAVIPDSELRDGVKLSLERKILRVYREFYEKYDEEMDSVIRFRPEDVGHCLSNLFFGAAASGNSWTSSSSH
ncbi:OLC1v1034739C1 [Oldenlandia corymbosa var. corymbosa]|uniref:Exocyst subunit Exo70 family protein n=1 Tax=Oldenlandia corymbosa var. corymbosa TaxID=529605 RepID=A0AAV1CU58_OLDCO|nr:OLC1v1034739C1 [Oldenlandia corymbosa var. corymbosa]